MFNKLFRRKYKYFISYFSSDGIASIGFGNACVIRDCKIKTIEDIKAIEDSLARKDNRKYTIINYKRA